jgi:hypothetical protein
MRRTGQTWVWGCTALLFSAARAAAQGCAMCGNSLGPDDPLTGAINTSVVFLLLMPYTILAGVGGWLYFRYRQRGPQPRASIIALPWARVRAAASRAPEKE